MMVPATRVDPTKMAVQLEFAQNPVCSQQRTILNDLVKPEVPHLGLQNSNLWSSCGYGHAGNSQFSDGMPIGIDPQKSTFMLRSGRWRAGQACNILSCSHTQNRFYQWAFTTQGHLLQHELI